MDADLVRDARWDDFPCRRRRGWQPAFGGFRWCLHYDERHRTDRDELRPTDHDELRPTDHGVRRPTVHQGGREADFHWCRHGTRPAGEPDDPERVGAQHPNTNPRCRRHRRHRTTRWEQWARRSVVGANPNQWANRGRGGAVLRWVARSNAEATRPRSRNSTVHCPTHRHRRNGVHRSRLRRRTNPRRHYGATCRRSSVPPALRRRAVLALSCSRPDRSSRRDPE